MTIGAPLVLAGFLWFIWDHNSNAPGWLFGGAAVCIAIGAALP
jgi:hypothetical protein